LSRFAHQLARLTDSSYPPAQLHVSSLSVTPNEPEPGSPVSVLIGMVPDISITDASIHVNVELFGVAVPGGARAYR